MQVERIALADFHRQMRRLLQAFVKGKHAYLRDLVPDNIVRIFSDNGIPVTRYDLEYWHTWEYRQRDISESEFLSSVLGDLMSSDQDVVIVSDDCFSSGEVYKLPVQELIPFSEAHPEMVDLFQPSDHLFYFPVIRVLIVVHHEGVVFRLNLS